MTKVKVEFFKESGKFYTSFEYDSNIPAFNIPLIRNEVEQNSNFIKRMSYTIEVDQNEKGWNKWLFKY